MQEMQVDLTMEELDADGALRETAAAAAEDARAGGLTRAGLFGGGAFGAAALLGLSAGPAEAQAKSDVAILNFALTLEYLEAAFYAEAVRKGALRGERRLFARVVGSHEAAHVQALKGALGRAAVAKPRFNFKGTTESASAFTKTAIALEETGTAAYKGQAANIKSDAILAAALSIHSVEARHTAWIRDIAGLNPAPVALDPPATKAQTLATVARTGFIVGPARRRRPRRTPPFTG
jgi:ferritin-like protein